VDNDDVRHGELSRIGTNAADCAPHVARLLLIRFRSVLWQYGADIGAKFQLDTARAVRSTFNSPAQANALSRSLRLDVGDPQTMESYEDRM
jgi:hypothetical protein